MSDELWNAFKEYLTDVSNPENFPEDPQTLFPGTNLLQDYV